ncbi:3-bisphosphoglycerate-independent phosphoglycerate mutase [Striga asiatica]|uniref:3-bisphosphoglycerate-independent phosphoglycerate mutase n=1 Tax=Striga asiatica TaxID=4170 RepID=A0A5A7RBB8_STRAF|nr:3-bisphosphoglycerate-independent phosphoglycerate mutase [Striga asiatica]
MDYLCNIILANILTRLVKARVRLGSFGKRVELELYERLVSLTSRTGSARYLPIPRSSSFPNSSASNLSSSSLLHPIVLNFASSIPHPVVILNYSSRHHFQFRIPSIQKPRRLCGISTAESAAPPQPVVGFLFFWPDTSTPHRIPRLTPLSSGISVIWPESGMSSPLFSSNQGSCPSIGMEQMNEVDIEENPDVMSEEACNYRRRQRADQPGR